MPPNKPQSNYSKRPVRKIRLVKIGPRKTESLIEEYFYGFVASICVIVTILGKAGGLSGYEAIVTGLWVGALLWFARQFRQYRKERGSIGRLQKYKQAVQTAPAIGKPLSPNFKPMIGPQWPLKTGPAPTHAATVKDPQGKKPVFVYERPTLPDRKPKLPANWAGKQDKKPKP